MSICRANIFIQCVLPKPLQLRVNSLLHPIQEMRRHKGAKHREDFPEYLSRILVTVQFDFVQKSRPVVDRNRFLGVLWGLHGSYLEGGFAVAIETGNNVDIQSDLCVHTKLES